MEENNKHAPAPTQENTQGGHKHRSRRHRSHRGGAGRPRPDGNAAREQQAVREATDTPEAAGKENAREKAPEARPHNKQNANDGRNPQKKNHKSRGGKGHQGNGQGGRKFPESRPYNPYEAPSREEIALSELRAKIVLQSADGTVPTVYGSTPTPVPRTEERAVEAEQELAAPVSAELENVDPDAAPASEEPTDTEPIEKIEVIGVRFRSAGKTYYFDPHGLQVKKGDFAIVETTRGPEFGEISLANSMINAKETVAPLRPLIRIATSEDIAQNEENRAKEKKAFPICQEKIEKHKLEMKLIDVQYAFDGSKILFYFAAEGRVDFRELVKDLAAVFRTRIELRQIGIRDEAKMLGGIGACGRALCCSTFLPDFAQVSIKMAKDQNLSLNSSKISGVCGRLMCCLRYEADTYAEEIRKTPSNDTLVRTEDGVGVVIGSNPLAGTIRVLFKDSPDTAPKQYHRDEVTVLGKERRGGAPSQKQEENE